MENYSALRQLSLGVVAIALLSVASLPIQARADAEQDKPAFSDVPPTHWAYKAVQRLTRAGIIEGYPLNSEQRIPVTVANSKEDSAATSVKVGLAAHVALKGSHIAVVATPASVTLSGTVRNQVQKNLAENIAKQQAPDRMIINQLKIVAPSKH